MAVTKEQMIASVQGYIKAVSTGDASFIDQLYADNARVEDPVGFEPKTGKASIAAFYASAFKMSVSLELAGPVCCAANCAAFPFTLSMQGMNIDVVDVFEFNEAGQVVSMKAYWSM
ncbi:MAG: nuclear transport factor 2 family protein [Pseudomonadales bacterium]|nr:nuclear transport factor 2 family protein [Pseudomonadales bacterium]